jgi:pimeloyl-ACP methyl ester carboxylesterase
MQTLPHFLEKGQGPSIVFQHGTLMDATMFAPQLDHLAAHGYRAIAQNSRVLVGRNEPHGLGDLVDDTLKLMDELGLEKTVLAGMSVGAFMALEFALKHQDRLSGLVLIDGKAVAYTPEEQVLFAAEFKKCDVDGPVPRAFAEWAAPFCFGATTYARNKGLADHWISRWASLVPARAVYHQSGSWLHKADLTERLAELRIPVLILHGAEDVPIPLERALAMVPPLPDVTFVKVPGAGHTSNLENPEVVNHALGCFLSRVYGR